MASIIFPDIDCLMIALPGRLIPETGMWRTHDSFQNDGAGAAIHQFLGTIGCILAESVGLGETFTALAAIKYLQMISGRILGHCPK